MFGGGALLFLESIIRLWHICRTNIKINNPLQIISRHYTQHLYSFEQRSDNQCINVNYTDMLWISSLNINKIKHFERILARWEVYPSRWVREQQMNRHTVRHPLTLEQR